MARHLASRSADCALRIGADTPTVLAAAATGRVAEAETNPAATCLARGARLEFQPAFLTSPSGVCAPEHVIPSGAQ